MKTERSYKWIVLMYSLPAKPSGQRVRIWKKLKKLGAVALKHTVYILPFSSDLQETILWLSQEINEVGGETTLLTVESIENMSQEQIIELFQKARNEDYKKVAKDCEKLLAGLNKTPQEMLPEKLGKCFTDLKELAIRLNQIKIIDYFPSKKGLEVRKLLTETEARLGILETKHFSQHVSRIHKCSAEDFKGKTWVTRARPYIDRIASSWIIKKCIDNDATIKFITDNDSLGEGEIGFDMAGVELSHHGEDCTFETIIKLFDIEDPILLQMSKIIHDVDLKDDKYGRQEASGIDVLLKGLLATTEDDHDLLEKGSLIFDAIYSGLCE